MGDVNSAGSASVCCRVLVVEDEMTQQILLESVLERLPVELEITWVDTASDALEWLRGAGQASGRPCDLVVTDIFLDGRITGIDLMKVCRNIYPRMPVMIVSALPYDKFREFESENSEPVDYIEKPLDPEKFMKHALSLLLRGSSPRASAGEVSP